MFSRKVYLTLLRKDYLKLKNYRKMSTIVNKLYQEHEKLASQYASKVFNLHKISFEREDLVQELKVKIYTSIQTHQQKLEDFEKGEGFKPVPLEFYLKAVLNNKIKDFIGLIEKEVAYSPMEEKTIDWGVRDSELNVSDKKWVINGIDLTEGLGVREKLVFVRYMKGETIKELKKNFGKVCDIRKTIDDQIDFIKRTVRTENNPVLVSIHSEEK